MRQIWQNKPTTSVLRAAFAAIFPIFREFRRNVIFWQYRAAGRSSRCIPKGILGGASILKNYCDGGEAILEAFRNLGIDYILSSPGSEWSSVWEALARQKTGNRPGPTYFDLWHETIAVDMAI